MSKKHFNALAQALANVRPGFMRPPDYSGERATQWGRDIRAIAEICYDNNARFNYHRFIEACETWEAK